MRTGYLYIKDLFSGILSQSTKIEGRFHIGHRYGLQEINLDMVGEVIKDVLPQTNAKKYPLSIMTPPTSRGEENGAGNGWRRYRIIIFFVDTTYYTSNKEIKSPNPNTRLSTEKTEEVWDNMAKVAMDFYSKLIDYQRTTVNSKIRVPKNTFLLHPVSEIGADRVSGVKFDFDLDVYDSECDTIQDYKEDYIKPNIDGD